MNKTKRHIAYLLESRGFVEIPGVGSFSRHHKSASFDGAHLLPPGSVISFDSSDGNSGGVELQGSIMRAEHTDSEQAFAILSEGIGAIRKELNVCGVSQMPGVGTLSRNCDDMLVFNQANSTEFCYPALELHSIREQRNDYRAQHREISEEQRATFMRSLRRTASAAAVIALFVFVAFIVSQFPGRHGATTQAAFSVESSPLPVTAIATTVPTQPTSDASLILVFNTPADASSPVEYDAKSAAVAEQSSTDARYCLVVASLANQTEADKYMSYAGQGLSLLVKDGRYRVYALEASTAEELRAMADEAEIYKTYPSAWVCRK